MLLRRLHSGWCWERSYKTPIFVSQYPYFLLSTLQTGVSVSWCLMRYVTVGTSRAHQCAAMPSGRQWLKGRHHPWAQSANAWSEDTDDTPALWRREQRQCLFLVWKCPIPLIDSLVVFVGRVSHIVRRARMALDSVLRWGQWICPCGWKMSYLAECSCVKSAGWGLPSCTWWRVLTLLQQCRADPGDPLQGMSEATHSTHTHRAMCMVD